MEEDIAYLGLVDDEAIALDGAALEIAALDHPDVDIEDHAAFLDGLAERLGDLDVDAAEPSAQAAALARVIAREAGFTGDADSYDDPANADLIRVIERRRGLPVALSILYVALARRMGWDADALDVPGHVIVRIGDAADGVFVDPFHDGARIGPEQVAMLVAHGSAADGARTVGAMTNRQTLVRLLRNQALRAEESDDVERARLIYRRTTIVAPDDAAAWWRGARLDLVAGDTGAARAKLGSILEITRDPALRRRVAETMAALTAG